MTRTSITLPDDLLRESKKVSENFSAFVAEALRMYIREVKIKRAKASFGSWEDRGRDSVDIVKELREEGDRNYADNSR